MLIGKIKAALKDDKGAALELSSGDGEDMLTAAYGLPVKITVFSKRLGFLGLSGRVYIANNSFWRINEICLLGDNERRGFFRVKARTQASVIGPNTANEAETFSCTVLNVSLSGLLFAVDNERASFPKGTELEVKGLRVRSEGEVFNISCKVHRTGNRPALGKTYGCSYLEMEGSESDRLCKEIFAKQRYDIKKKRRTI